tara:strand:+ start:256 stop:567 length:312 start_codon:yes stop_codon:yes gene_type:complete
MKTLILEDGSKLSTVAQCAEVLKAQLKTANDANAIVEQVKGHVRLNAVLNWFTHGVFTKVVNTNRRDAKEFEKLAIQLGATQKQIDACYKSGSSTHVSIQEKK